MMKQKVGLRKKNAIITFLTEGAVKWYDWILLLAVFAFCFLVFGMRDLNHTAGCSFGYLNGHFADFYDYLEAVGIDENGGQGLYAAYLPTIYILFAVWNAPMRLFGFGGTPTAGLGIVPILWAKILPSAVFVLSAYFVFQIAKTVGLGEKKSKIAMYAYLSMPVAIFAQFMMGQYESIAAFTVILGVYYWLKKKPFWFVFWFAVGVSLKYTVLIFFLPLLLLGEKNFWKILLQAAGVCTLTALEILLYWHSPAFHAHVFGFGGGNASPVNNLFAYFYETGFVLRDASYQIYVVVLAVAGTLAYSYFLSPKDDGERARYAMFLMPLSFAAMFLFVKWHPQWFLLVIPYWTITAFMTKHTRIRMLLEMLFMALMVVFVAHYFAFVLDETMLNQGVLKYLMPGRQTSEAITMAELLRFPSASLALSLLAALMAIFAIFSHPKYQLANLEADEPHTVRYVRGRTYIGLLVFMIPAAISFFLTVNPPKAHYVETTRSAEASVSENILQPFTATGQEISKIKFRKGGEALGDGELPVQVKVLKREEDGAFSLYDETYTVLYEGEYDASRHYPSEQVVLRPEIKVEAGEEYYLYFGMEESLGSVTLCYSTEKTEEYPNALVGGREQNYHMSAMIFE